MQGASTPQPGARQRPQIAEEPLHAVSSIAELQAVVLDCVNPLLAEPAAADAPLAAQGLDSLASMELRQKLQVCPHSHVLLMIHT